jgi:hypothetical protein
VNEEGDEPEEAEVGTARSGKLGSGEKNEKIHNFA